MSGGFILAHTVPTERAWAKKKARTRASKERARAEKRERMREKMLPKIEFPRLLVLSLPPPAGCITVEEPLGKALFTKKKPAKHLKGIRQASIRTYISC